MNSFYKRFQTITIYLSIFLHTPIYPEWSPGPRVTFPVFTHNTHHRDSKGDRIHADFSHNTTSGIYKDYALSLRANNFKLYAASDFQRYFSERGYTSLEILDQRCLYMFDEFVKYAKTYSEYQDTIRKLYAELKNLGLFQKAYRVANGSYCRGLQKRIRYLYNQLDTIKKASYSPNFIAVDQDFFSEQFAEYKTLESVYNAYMPSLAQAVNTRLDVYEHVVDGRLISQNINKSYNLASNVEQLLLQYGHEAKNFTQCYGNQLQQVIHQESLDILDHVDRLSCSSGLYDHQEALVDFAVAMVDYNHANMSDKAMRIGDLCWTLLDYSQAIAEGIALGAYSAAHDILTNPIQATVSIVAGKQILAFQLCKVFYNVAEIGATAITNFDHAKEKWNKYTEPLNNLIDAISKKEIAVRDVIKGGTAFVVGYKAQGKLLGGLGKFCSIVKQKSLNFVKNNPLFDSQEYLITPEGLLLKAISKSNKIKCSGQANTASNLKNIVDNKVSKSDALSTVVVSGKGILCKGDLRAKIKRYEEHIFSPEHQRDGIFALGKDKATIMNSLHDIIISLDQKGLLKEGANQIRAAINGIDNVEIRCFIQDGEAISVNAYLSRFNRIYGNFIDITKV